jgi:hypothetical protein
LDILAERLLIEHDQAHPNSAADQTRKIMDIQPIHQLRAMGLDGLNTQMETMADLLRGAPFRDQLEYFTLAVGEEVGGFFSMADPLKIISDHLLRYRRAEIDFAARALHWNTSKE